MLFYSLTKVVLTDLALYLREAVRRGEEGGAGHLSIFQGTEMLGVEVLSEAFGLQDLLIFLRAEKDAPALVAFNWSFHKKSLDCPVQSGASARRRALLYRPIFSILTKRRREIFHFERMAKNR